MSTETPFSRLLATKEVVVVCGPGGVGKTTLAASIALAAAADTRRRVLVLTVDPARRLADALGIAGIGNDAVEIPGAAFDAAGIRPAGSLAAAMLDVKASWDALVRRYASDEASASTILSSPLYRDLTARFPGSAEYIAMERLHELHTEGGFDLIVVDTPPGSRALDLFDAPDRLAEFFSSRLLRWLTVPARSRLGGAASKLFSHVAERILGSSFLEEIRTLFVLLGEMQGGFVDRAEQVSGLLRAGETTFCVVTTPEAIPVEEGGRLLGALASRGLHLGLLVANRVLPACFVDPGAIALADALAGGEPSAAPRPPPGCDPGVFAGPRSQRPAGASPTSRPPPREAAEILATFSSEHLRPATVGDEMDDVVDLAQLAEIGRRLLAAPAARRAR